MLEVEIPQCRMLTNHPCSLKMEAYNLVSLFLQCVFVQEPSVCLMKTNKESQDY